MERTETILPAYGEVAAAQRLTEGALVRALRMPQAPSTTVLPPAELRFRVVPLPASGEDL